MYGFTESNAPVFLKGLDLLQVCVGENEIILNFDKESSVTVMSIVSFAKNNRDFLYSIVNFEKSCIGDKVNDVCRLSERFISLEFLVGGRLIIEDDSRDCESVIIRKGQTTYSV